MAALLDQYAVGTLVEVQGVDDGFLGSWYGCRVLEVQERRSRLRLKLRYEACQEDDGSFWEDWFDIKHVRPAPPAHDPQFIDTLSVGQPLEINHEDGWWEVLLVGAAERTAELPKYIVEARRYKVRHIVPASSLRPAWKWVAAACSWEMHTEAPPPPDVPKKKK